MTRIRMRMRRLLSSRTLRPYLLIASMVLLFALADGGQGRFLSRATAFSVLQQFATIGPFALALGLSMVIREFDLSIAGMLSLAGCVAVLAGRQNAALGVAAALAVGAASGAFNGVVMVTLRLPSVGVTLGSLLSLSGLAYVLTGNETIAFANAQATTWVNAPVFGVFTPRSASALGAFAAAAVVMHATRWGRDVFAVGSDRNAALLAGVRVSAVVVAIFMVSGMLTALAGALLSFSLAAASPIALANVLIPAAAAAIIGGVSLGGGRGTPAGIAGGVLVLCLLRSGLMAIAAPPYVQDVATGAVLLLVAVMDSPKLAAWLRNARLRSATPGLAAKP